MDDSATKCASLEVKPKPVTPQAGDDFKHPFSFSPVSKIFAKRFKVEYM